MLSDACLVRVTGLRKTNDCFVHILYRVDAPALASYNLQGVSFQQPPPQIHCTLTPICVWMCFQRSALRALLLWISKCIHYRILTMFATNVVCFMYLGHAFPTTNRRDFGREFTVCKFPNPPQIDCTLTPIYAWMCFQWCLLHAQRCVRSFGSISYACKTARYWQSCVILPFFGERLPTDVWWTVCKFLPPFPWDTLLLV